MVVGDVSVKRFRATNSYELSINAQMRLCVSENEWYISIDGHSNKEHVFRCQTHLYLTEQKHGETQLNTKWTLETKDVGKRSLKRRAI